MDKFNQSEDIMMPETFSEPSGTDNKPDDISNKISDLSKKGYQLIKENDILIIDKNIEHNIKYTGNILSVGFDDYYIDKD